MSPHQIVLAALRRSYPGIQSEVAALAVQALEDAAMLREAIWPVALDGETQSHHQSCVCGYCNDLRGEPI